MNPEDPEKESPAQATPSIPSTSPLEYAPAPRSSGGGVAVLVVSIFIAIGVTGFWGLAVMFFLGDEQVLAPTLLILVPLALITTAVLLKKRGIAKIALAIFLISVATFLLTIGLCATFPIHLGM